jgi:hypothetical protein
MEDCYAIDPRNILRWINEHDMGVGFAHQFTSKSRQPKLAPNLLGVVSAPPIAQSIPLTDRIILTFTQLQSRRTLASRKWENIATVPELSPALVKYYYAECLRCLELKLPVAAIILSCTCLQVALQDALSFAPSTSPWRPLGKNTKQLGRMDLSELLDWARQVGCLSRTCWEKVRKIMGYRNALVHPGLDYRKIVKAGIKRHDRMAKAFREIGSDHISKLDATALFVMFGQELATDTVSEVHGLIREIYTRGPFARGGLQPANPGGLFGRIHIDKMFI